MTTHPISTHSYSRLLQHIQQQISEGLAAMKRAYEQEKIITYWNIGKSITQNIAQHKIHSDDYGKQLYKKLSHDLNIGERLLHQISQFYTTYPTFKPSQNLNWTHYRLLTSVKDSEQRTMFESKVSNDKLSHRALEQFLKQDKNNNAQAASQAKSQKPKKLAVKKGTLYTYATFKAAYADTMLIDCGFSIYKESDATTIQSGFVETVKTKTGYACHASSATNKDLYTYKAFVEKVVDGDTLWLTIDCGFTVWVHQKIRLRGIDTPEMSTKQGVASRTFVLNALKDLPFVVVKSHGRDKYGRFLMDVFYLRNEEDPRVVLDKGLLLNQMLLDEGLAKIMHNAKC